MWQFGLFPLQMVGWDSRVGIVTCCYGLNSPGIESRWGWDFCTCPDWPWGPPSLLYKGYRVFPGGKERLGMKLTPHPLLVPWWRNGRAIPLLPLWTIRPVQSLSRAIPLLPLWAVRPVQSLSACTRVHFTLPYIKIMELLQLRDCNFMCIKINLFLGNTMHIYVSVLLRHAMNSKVFYIFIYSCI